MVDSCLAVCISPWHVKGCNHILIVPLSIGINPARGLLSMEHANSSPCHKVISRFLHVPTGFSIESHSVGLIDGSIPLAEPTPQDLLFLCCLVAQVVMMCDLHGHSRKFNIFMYGCEKKAGRDTIAAGPSWPLPGSVGTLQGVPMQYQEKIFPLMVFANVPDLFSYRSSNFKVRGASSCRPLLERTTLLGMQLVLCTMQR